MSDRKRRGAGEERRTEYAGEYRVLVWLVPCDRTTFRCQLKVSMTSMGQFPSKSSTTPHVDQSTISECGRISNANTHMVSIGVDVRHILHQPLHALHRVGSAHAILCDDTSITSFLDGAAEGAQTLLDL